MSEIVLYETVLRKSKKIKVPVDKISSAEIATFLFKRLTDDSPCEKMFAVYLNGQHSIIGIETLSKGGVGGTSITAREVFQGAFIANASAIIMGHNHPSDSVNPSNDDIHITKKVKEAGEMIGIPLLDHIIVTKSNGSRSIIDYI